MNNSLKLTSAALLVLGSTQASANDFELDISKQIAQTMNTYMEQTVLELKQSISTSIEQQAQELFDSYVSKAQEDEAEQQVSLQLASNKQ